MKQFLKTLLDLATMFVAGIVCVLIVAFWLLLYAAVIALPFAVLAIAIKMIF